MLLLRRSLLVCVLIQCGFLAGSLAAQTDFKTVVVFGDSLSDTGNIANLVEHANLLGIRYPADNKTLGFDYTDGRFTDGADTQPAAQAYFGVWVEQLAASFPSHPAVKDSLDGGTNYAYGDATTGSGTQTESTTVDLIPVSITLNNMGQQVTTYLATNPSPNAQTLYVLWGGGNDLLNAAAAGQDPVAAAQTAVANEIALVQKLMAAGATNFLIPNQPPLGAFAAADGPAAVTALNVASAAFAQGLTTGLAALKQGAMGATLNIYQPDVFTLFGEIAGAPMSFGLGNITSPAQNISASPDTYLLWDGLHPTTTGHNFVAQTAAALFSPLSVTSTALTVPAGSLAGQKVTVSATVTPGKGSTVPSGLVTFFDGTTVVGSGPLNSTAVAQVTFTPTESAGGTVALSAAYAGDVADNPSVAPVKSVPLLSAAVGTTIAVTSSSASANQGASLTLTATVTPSVATYGTPTGTVTFLDGTTTLGSGTLNGSGVATYTAASLSVGTHSITASYAAAGVFGGSTSAVYTETVVAPGFTAQASPTSLTIASGSSGTTTLTVALTGGYAGTVTPTCGTLPAHFSCTITLLTLPTPTGTTEYSLKISTKATTTAMAANTVLPAEWGGARVWSAGLALPGMLGLLGVGVRGRRKKLHGLMSAGAVMVFCAWLLSVAGCGGSPSNNAAAGSYSVPVIFTPASVSNVTPTIPSQTINIAVTVQ